MDGIHDMGGLVTFGPVRPEADEPVFHHPWEARTFAMNIAGFSAIGPVDRARHAIERMDPVEYLSTSYYEHWLHTVVTLFQELGYVSAEEMASGVPNGQPPVLRYPPFDAEQVEGVVRSGGRTDRACGAAPAFAIGQQVRARNLEVKGHTRLPRYVRGRRGTVIGYHGCHVFPDTHAHDLGENPQPLYSVRFEARELWGENVTRRDCVLIDLWESYLEPLES